jgi:hypothetical protein
MPLLLYLMLVLMRTSPRWTHRRHGLPQVAMCSQLSYHVALGFSRHVVTVSVITFSYDIETVFPNDQNSDDVSAKSEGNVAVELGTNCNLGKTMASVCPTWRCPHHPPLLELESSSTPSWRFPHQVSFRAAWKTYARSGWGGRKRSPHSMCMPKAEGARARSGMRLGCLEGEARRGAGSYVRKDTREWSSRHRCTDTDVCRLDIQALVRPD